MSQHLDKNTTLLRAKSNQPLSSSKQVIVCQLYWYVCVSAVCTYMCASASRQKWCCCRLPESGPPLSPAGSKMLKWDAHVHTHMPPVEITQECPQVSLFNKLGAFYIQEGGGVKKCQSTDIYIYIFFFIRPWVKRTCQKHVWDYWEPSPVKKWQRTNEKKES